LAVYSTGGKNMEQTAKGPKRKPGGKRSGVGGNTRLHNKTSKKPSLGASGGRRTGTLHTG